MKLKNLTLLAIAFSITALTLNSCKPTCEKNPDDPECIQNDPEVVTTVQLLFRDSITNNIVGTFEWKDADGDGTGAPVVDQINLDANTTYKVSLTLLNELANPTEDMTLEIEEEANEHQFFFDAQGVNVNVAYDDQDDNNPPLPVGLLTVWGTGAAGSGQLHLTLKHYHGNKDGNSSSGETDIDLEFPVLVQ